MVEGKVNWGGVSSCRMCWGAGMADQQTHTAPCRNTAQGFDTSTSQEWSYYIQWLFFVISTAHVSSVGV